MKRICATVLLATLTIGGLTAHPHMWIRGNLMPILNQKGLEALDITWIMDDFTSGSLLLDYDTDRNGQFSRAESETLRDEGFSHLRDVNYFLVAQQDGRNLIPGDATNYQASVEDDRVIYRFRLPMAVDWKNLEQCSFFMLDSSYFIDFRYDDMAGRNVAFGDRSVRFELRPARFSTEGYGEIDIIGLKALSVQ